MGRKRAPKTATGFKCRYNTVVEPQPSIGNIQLSRALDSQLEIPLPGLTSPKHPNLLVDGVEMRHAKSPAQEQDLTVIDSEKDEADTQLEQVLLADPELELLELPLEHEHESEPELAYNLGEKKSWKEKVDCALQRIEALDKTVELLKSKVDENIVLCEAPSMSSISYKSMYIDSQKKVEALTVENQRLNGKLENALGKIGVYKDEIHVLVDVKDKTKDAVKDTMISNVAKTIETAVNVSNQAMQIHNACSASAVKRKRNVS
ncbi:hypothetical protein AAZX31_03G135600 [Glycine max]